MVARIVSGGQTGADRAALDVARELGIPIGGWCPAGGLAEDLSVPPGLLARYPELRETSSDDPAERTRANVRDSDATLVLVPGATVTSPGTALTVTIARELGRPHLVVAVSDLAAITRWVGDLPDTAVLNVAGPRESQAPGHYAACARVLRQALTP